MLYLDKYLEDNALKTTIKDLYAIDPAIKLDGEDFRKVLNSRTDKEIDWFFDDYIQSHVRMDWKIRSVKKLEDSVVVKLKNKSGRLLPVPIQTLR